MLLGLGWLCIWVIIWGMNKKSLAWMLVALSFLYYFFPQWNGFFDSRDISQGEGTIIWSILFVGGILLWYLPVKD